MSNIVEKISGISGLGCSKGCTFEQIKVAQKELDLTFPDEYLDYVKKFGCIDFGATEWTGLNIKGYLNTVTATNQEKCVNPSFPEGCFVLENLNIDAKTIIVDEEGKVYILQYNKVTPLCNSISDYLDICIERNR